MCLRYPPTIVSCVCIHLACKWSDYQIPLSAEGKTWFQYVDNTGQANLELLERLVTEFLAIFNKCPSRLRKKIMASTKATKESGVPGATSRPLRTRRTSASGGRSSRRRRRRARRRPRSCRMAGAAVVSSMPWLRRISRL